MNEDRVAVPNRTTNVMVKRRIGIQDARLLVCTRAECFGAEELDQVFKDLLEPMWLSLRNRPQDGYNSAEALAAAHTTSSTTAAKKRSEVYIA